MKKNILLIALAVFGLGFLLAQTETEQKMKELKARRALAREQKGLFTEELDAQTIDIPCTLYDDDEWYTAFNQMQGRRGDAKLRTALLQSNQYQLRQKIGGAYKNVTRDYFDQMELNDRSAAASHIESTGEMVIEKILNDTREACYKEVWDNSANSAGNMIAYMSIKVSKRELIDKLATALSEDKQLGVRFNEQKFREAAMKVFEQSATPAE